MDFRKQIFKTEPCPHCRHYSNRGLSIDALIVRKNKILLVKRGAQPFKDYWALSGGYVDWSESVEEAVKREVKEETNLESNSLQLMGVYSLPKRHQSQVITIVYIVESEGDPQSGDDAQEVEWFTLDNLPEVLAFDHKQIIEDYLRKNQ